MRSRRLAASYVLAVALALTILALAIRVIAGSETTAQSVTVPLALRSLGMAVIYYSPIAAVLGWGLTRLMDWRDVFGLRYLWAILGVLGAAPVILFCDQVLGLPPFDEASVHIIAAVSGMAGRWGYERTAPSIRGTSPATTRS